MRVDVHHKSQINRQDLCILLHSSQFLNVLAPWHWIAEEAIFWFGHWSTYYYVSALSCVLYYVSKFLSTHKFEIEITSLSFLFLGQI